MGERPDQIEKHIEDERWRLGANVNDLETKVKNTFDWRVQFQQRPMTFIGVAFGTGVLLSTMGNRGSRSSTARRIRSTSELSSESRSSYPRQKLWQTWDNIKGALMGVAAAQVKNFLGDAIPGFHDHYRTAERKNMEAGGQHLSSPSPMERTGTMG
jgi:hypothetical protein